MSTTRRVALILAILSLPLMLLAGCGDKKSDETASVPAAGDQTAQMPAGTSGQAATPAGAFMTGKILETMNSGGYSYMKLDSDKGEVWVAGPETPGLEVGQTVSLTDGMMMPNFTAKSLDRTFESIYFTGGIMMGGASAAAGQGGMPGMSGMGDMNQPVSGTSTSLEKADIEGVAKLDGGYTVAEIYAKADELAGKNVKLRAQVVKYTPNIMGTNWVHVQDGTGDADTSDLTVTTSGLAKVGDKVIIDGVLAVDKDFGAGYKYHVIVEQANITKD